MSMTIHRAGCLALLGSCLAAAPAGAGEANAEAREKLAEIASAYQAAPALVDEFEVEFRGARGGSTKSAQVRLGEGNRAQVEMDGFVITAAGDRLYIHRPDAPGKYFAAPLGEDLPSAYRAVTGAPLPAPQCVLRYGDPGEYASAFGLGRVDDLEVTGYNTLRRDGRRLGQLQLRATGGATVRALIDLQTRFISSVELLDGTTVVAMRMSPRVHERLPESIDFDPGDRRRVESLAQLVQLSAGDPAPKFTLETLDGETVSLEDLRGSVVVLDFWASWCGPCRWALRELEKLYQWAEAEDCALAVYPVDMGERVRGREAKRRRVAAFWQGQGYTMPTLIDYDNSVARAYEVGPIPHTVIIDPQGKILEVERGFNPRLVDHVKQLVRGEPGGEAHSP